MVREGGRDKVAEQQHIKTGVFIYRNERIVTLPNYYVCETCGRLQSCNYTPLKSWEGDIIPTCEDVVVQSVQET